MQKKALKILALSIPILIAFRGLIFRALITYDDVGSRTHIELNDTLLIDKIRSHTKIQPLDIHTIVEIASELTTENLGFAIATSSKNPNVLARTRKANCVGYAAMFNTIAVEIIETEGLEKQFSVHHKIGKLHFLGLDLHRFSDTPFFKDHDFNLITNLYTGEKYGIDASVSDYLGVDYIRLK